MRSLSTFFLSAALLVLPVTAIIQDEAYETDWHIPLIGNSVAQSTFFHRPLPESKASIIYTLTDRKVVAAIHPRDGNLVWRQSIAEDAPKDSDTKAILRPAEGQVLSAAGNVVRAWDATDGRLIWASNLNSAVKDVQITNDGAVVVLCEDRSVRKLSGSTGSVIDEVNGILKQDDLPHALYISSKATVVISLAQKYADEFALQTTTIFSPTKIDTLTLSESEVDSPSSIIFVGGPGMVAWIEEYEDKERNLFLQSLVSPHMSSSPIPQGVTRVQFHAASGANEFMISFETASYSWAELWKKGGEDGGFMKIHSIAPKSVVPASWSASITSNSQVYFTWTLPMGTGEIYSTTAPEPAHTFIGNSSSIKGSSFSISEVISRPDNTFALRTFLDSFPDGNTHLILNGGSSQWTRPESLAGMKAAVWVELLDPTTEEIGGDLHVEETQSILSAYIHRVKRHAHELVTYGPAWASKLPDRLISEITGTERVEEDTEKFRDAFGFRKFVVGVTGNGGLAAIDVGRKGKIVWSLHRVIDQKEDIKGFYEIGKGIVALVTESGTYVEVNAFDGLVLKHQTYDDVKAVFTTALVDVGKENKAVLGIIHSKFSDAGEVKYFGGDRDTSVIKDFYVVTADDSGYVGGLKINPGSLKPEQTFVFVPPPLEIITDMAAAARNTPPASIGKVLGDRSVMYKYINPHLLLVTTARLDRNAISVYLLDSVSGAILYTATHTSVDKDKPVVSVVFENWFVYSFFSVVDPSDDSPNQVTGYQLVVTELYESPLNNDRGPLGAQTNISSFSPNVIQAKPYTISQAYVFPKQIIALATTATKQSITTTDILALLAQPPSLLSIPKRILDPRRPADRELSASEKEEGLFKYEPVVGIDYRNLLTHKRDLLPVTEKVKIMTSPSLMESTSLVFLYTETDIFGTRVSPSGPFDMLGKGFGKLQLIATMVGLAVGVRFVSPMVRKKQINQRWTSS